MTRPGMFIGTREFEVAGEMLSVGQPAPDFRLTANNWETKTLESYAGKVKIISIVPSLDTRVCSAQTRRFNQEAANIDERVVILTVSTDLPYAQHRWCGAEGITAVVTLSDHKDVNFGQGYGYLVNDLRVLQRGTVVIDQHNIIRHVEYVPMMGDEVNFDAALEAARAALA